MEIHTIRSVRPLEHSELELTYEDGTVVRGCLREQIALGGVFTPLSDPAFFKQVSLGERGRFVTWPGEIDLCADAHWEQRRGVIL